MTTSSACSRREEATGRRRRRWSAASSTATTSSSRSGAASAKYHNIGRQPRVVLSVPDGRSVLTVYGNGELMEEDPDRVDAFQAILTSYGMPESPVDELRTSMDDEQRVVLRLHPTSMDLHE